MLSSTLESCSVHKHIKDSAMSCTKTSCLKCPECIYPKKMTLSCVSWRTDSFGNTSLHLCPLIRHSCTGLCMKTRVSGTGTAGCESCLHQFLTVWSWTSYLSLWWTVSSCVTWVYNMLSLQGSFIEHLPLTHNRCLKNFLSLSLANSYESNMSSGLAVRTLALFVPQHSSTVSLILVYWYSYLSRKGFPTILQL